jgi:hypothetical protein
MMMTVSVYAFVHLCLVGASKIQFTALPEQKFILHAVKQKFTIYIHINCLYFIIIIISSSSSSSISIISIKGCMIVQEASYVT